MPFFPGVVAFGLAFGTTAVSNGVPPFAAVAMSMLVFAGSSQFVATKLIGDGAPALVILLATFLINLRHFLYSASMSSFFRPVGLTWRWLLAYPIVDESYGLTIARYRRGELLPREFVWFYAGVSAKLICLWWSSTAVGATFGELLPDRVAEIFAFASTLILISLVVPLLDSRPALLAALGAALVGIVLAPLPHRLGLLAAAGTGILLGIAAEKHQPAAIQDRRSQAT